MKYLAILLLGLLAISGCKKIKFDEPIEGKPILPPISNNPPLVETGNYSLLTEEGKNFIMVEETGGKSYYNKFLKTPTVPPGSSGVTIGAGFDLRFYTPSVIKETWKDLGKSNAERLSKASGLTHAQSKEYLPKVKDILIEWDLATKIFNEHTIPDYVDLAIRTFSGLEKLKPEAIAAATSIIFNRGSSLTGDSRKEMRALKVAIANKDYQEMADQTRAMKRLWTGKGMDGLLKRREKEALLFESCLISYKPKK